MELKRTDVNSLETKLEEFAKNLPEQEQNVLGWIVARAKNASEEVEISDAELDTVSGGLADAAGFASEQDDSVEVTVKWTR
jgi:hypothetical protein